MTISTARLRARLGQLAKHLEDFMNEGTRTRSDVHTFLAQHGVTTKNILSTLTSMDSAGCFDNVVKVSGEIRTPEDAAAILIAVAEVLHEMSADSHDMDLAGIANRVHDVGNDIRETYIPTK